MSREELILSVDKPLGWTSFDVVHKLRKELGWKKVGHAGTLDPPATGVLIVLLGEATQRSNEFMDLPKEYRARIRFGLNTSTDDMDGEVLSTRSISNWNQIDFEKELQSFVGVIMQVPPAVSAVKVDGVRSYKRAFKNKPIELEPRAVTIYKMSLLAANEPEIEILVTCSRGTYIRSIARDLGEKLGWGGALSGLERTAIGNYRIEHSLTIHEILQRKTEFCP